MTSAYVVLTLGALALTLDALLEFMLASEITIDSPIFSNEYTWLHL